MNHANDTGSLPTERVVVSRRDHLELQPWQIPAPAAGELRVRVAYSAVSFGDVMLRRHVFRRRPTIAVPGYEVVGTVEAVGPGAAEPGFRVGDRVAAFIEYGGNARHALVRARDAVALPAGIDDARAAAAVLNYATASGLIQEARLAPGADFVIHGASGGVGTAVLDTARAVGLRAIGLTRAKSRSDLFGARLLDACSPTLVEQVREASDGEGVAAVFDPRSGRGLWRSRAMVRPGGSLVVFGLSSVAHRRIGAAVGVVGSLASLALFSALPGKRSSVFAMDKIYRRDPARVRVLVAGALDLLAAGAIAPIIGAILPLEEVAEAHRLVEAGAVVGKVVLDCQ
jgi:NADPH:quinone reductase-like Zn-dependent oxidoreductase